MGCLTPPGSILLLGPITLWITLTPCLLPRTFPLLPMETHPQNPRRALPQRSSRHKRWLITSSGISQLLMPACLSSLLCFVLIFWGRWLVGIVFGCLVTCAHTPCSPPPFHLIPLELSHLSEAGIKILSDTPTFNNHYFLSPSLICRSLNIPQTFFLIQYLRHFALSSQAVHFDACTLKAV
jgi:hypothetical protein